MRTGRAAVYTLEPRSPLQLREFPVPDPEPGEIVVRITTANVCGSDLHYWRGDIDLARHGLAGGTVLGHEMTGRVDRLGAGRATDSAGAPLGEGDRIVYRYFMPCGRCGPCRRGMTAACGANPGFQMRPAAAAPHFVGGFADYYVVPAGQAVYKVPDAVSDEVVSGANCALAQVIQGFVRAGLTEGETVAVQGAGGLGLYATAVAKHMGASVVVVDGVAERLALAREFGADATVDMTEFPDAAARAKEVRARNGGGADVAVEVVGVPQAFGEGVGLLGQGGRYVEIGNISPGMTLTFDPAYLTLGNKTVHGVAFYEAESLRRAVAFLEQTAARLPFEKVLGAKYSLEAINEAFADADARRVARAGVWPGLS